LLHSRKKETQEAADSFARALTFRMSCRDLEALASARANLALALLDLDELDAALENAHAGLNIGLNALQLGPVQTLNDQDIPQGSDAQQLLKAVATCLLSIGSVHERSGRECLTSYQSAMLFARHLVAGSECLASKIQQSYTSVLQLELQRACSTRDDTMFHSKVFKTSTRCQSSSSVWLQQELAAGRTGKVSRKFVLGVDVEFEAAAKMKGLRNGSLMQSRHLRNLAAACTMTLQCAVRSHVARQVCAQRRMRIPLETGPAVKVQRVLRGHVGRCRFRSLLVLSRHSSAVYLQACVQRRLHHDNQLRQLATHADARLPVSALPRPTPEIPFVSSATRARQLTAAAGLEEDTAEQTLAHCCHVLRVQGYHGDDIDTFALLLDRDHQAPVLAEQFYWAVLEVLLLRAKPSDVEDVREACLVFDLVLASNTAASQPASISLSSFLLTLGYADDEVDMIQTSLEANTSCHRFEAMTEEGGSPCRKPPADYTRLVSRQTFVPAMASMLSYARQARTAKQMQRRAEREMAQYEPKHPLLSVARKDASIRLQCAWRTRLARSRFAPPFPNMLT